MELRPSDLDSEHKWKKQKQYHIETWDLCYTSRWNSKHTWPYDTCQILCKNGQKMAWFARPRRKHLKHPIDRDWNTNTKAKRNPRAMPRYVVRRWPRKDAQQQPPIESVTQVPSKKKDSDVVMTVLNGKCYNCWKGCRHSVMKTGGQFQRTTLRVSIWELCRELSK